ncbi:MAG: tRNA (guanosine(37)-N1)-methyltransferase TrmD [Actinomycetota bacterium]|nr:tRNA (guanosine(37)-N1)-methyltransferase TrmD [Actinomycetota bacterium]
MRFDIISIFPDAFDSILGAGLVGRSIDEGRFEVAIHDLRRWAPPPHHKVDDTPFGGGPGMVMTPEPIVTAVEAIRHGDSPVYLLAAAGTQFDQPLAQAMSLLEQVVIVCGRYEGIDERVRTLLGAEELSVGPYVLSGGEPAAAVIIDAVGRLLSGVLGNPSSLAEESFNDGMLEYPQFTKPQTFRNISVPEVLLSGHHERIAAWRREQALLKTLRVRPELLESANVSDEERVKISNWRRQPD